MKTMFGLFPKGDSQGISELRFVSVKGLASESASPATLWSTAYDGDSGEFEVIIFVRCDKGGGVSDRALIMDAINRAQSEFCREIEPKKVAD